MRLQKIPDIQQLPDYQTLYQRSQSLATLDAIICEEWEMRYFDFNQNWDSNVNNKQAMGSMRDGEGSHYFILFDENKNVLGKVFDGEIGHRTISEIQNIAEFEYFLSEPAFINEDATWYFYRSNESKEWQVFPPENNLSFLEILANPIDYINWASEYFEMAINSETVKKILDFAPLTKDMVLTLNPNRNFDTLQEDLEDIGYPYDF